jgi:hypothetical protein
LIHILHTHSYVKGNCYIFIGNQLLVQMWVCFWLSSCYVDLFVCLCTDPTLSWTTRKSLGLGVLVFKLCSFKSCIGSFRFFQFPCGFYNHLAGGNNLCGYQLNSWAGYSDISIKSRHLGGRGRIAPYHFKTNNNQLGLCFKLKLRQSVQLVRELVF